MKWPEQISTLCIIQGHMISDCKSTIKKKISEKRTYKRTYASSKKSVAKETRKLEIAQSLWESGDDGIWNSHYFMALFHDNSKNKGLFSTERPYSCESEENHDWEKENWNL